MSNRRSFIAVGAFVMAGNRLVVQPMRPSRAQPSAELPLQAGLLLAMMLLLYTGHGAIWAYQEHIGVAASLNEHAVARWLGLSMLVGLVASAPHEAIHREDVASGALVGRILRSRTVIGLRINSHYNCDILQRDCFLLVLRLTVPNGVARRTRSEGPSGARSRHDVYRWDGVGPAMTAFLLVGDAHWPIGVVAGICYLLAMAIAVPSARSPSTLVSAAAT